MPRSAGVSVENKFVNGLVTEATALNFPGGSVVETDNLRYKTTAKTTRRLGFDAEANYVEETLSNPGYAINTFFWKNIGENGDSSFVVRQIGNTISFFRVDNTGNLSGNKHGTEIDITDFISSGGVDLDEYECDFASGFGYLFITHRHMEPIYVSYSSDDDDFTYGQINIRIRDFDGIEEDVSVTNRPTTLTDIHRYNLYNQGWMSFDSASYTTSHIAPYPTGYQRPFPDLPGDPLSTWYGNRSDYPSNSDVWWIYKDYLGIFNPKMTTQIDRGNSPAPKGHFILNPFRKDRSEATDVTVKLSGVNYNNRISGLALETSGAFRPKTVSFFAGRVWYGGVDSLGYFNKLYFSQVIKTEKEFGLCYQLNDPTSESLFDILSTDGGEITILDCAGIVKIVPYQNSLLIFGVNGVWSISGSQGIGFSATDYSITKLSSVPVISASSFVDVGGTPIWWNSQGIYAIGGNATLAQSGVTSLTDDRIKQFYLEDIPENSKFYAKGDFNPKTKEIQWVYRSTEPTTVRQKYQYNKILCINMETKAFYVYTVPDLAEFNGINCVYGKGTSYIEENVLNSSNAVVQDSSNDNVVIFNSDISLIGGTFKYLTSYNTSGNTYKFTFTEEKDEDFLDFLYVDTVGEEVDAYCITGYKVENEGNKAFQINYTFVFVDNSDSPKFYVQGIWDYGLGEDSYRYSNPQILDFNTTHRVYSYRKIKIRGSGISLQLKFTSYPGKPMDLVGWSNFVTGDQYV